MSHEKLAETFDRWVREGRADRLETSHGDIVAQVLERMGIRAGETVLDLGCGNGWATRLIAKAAPGVQAIGVDVSPAMVERAEELHSFTIRARYEVCPFEELDFADAHFDRAFGMESVYYAVDLGRALAELHRVLKPAGVSDLVVDFYAERPGTERWPELTGLAMHRLSEAEWRDAFEGAGFADVETRRVVDRRGPGDESDFTPSEWHADWSSKQAQHASGSLWIRGVKPA